MLLSQRDQPGTQREYETIYVLRPDADAAQISGVNTRVRKIIEDADGKLMRLENWGKRKLAYEIKKEHKGIYLYWRYLAQPHLVAELERNLRMLDLVLRFLTVKIDEDVDPNARPSEVTAVEFDAAAQTRPDEEDYYLGRTGHGSGSRSHDDDDDDEADDDADTDEASDRPRRAGGLLASATDDTEEDEDARPQAAQPVSGGGEVERDPEAVDDGWTEPGTPSDDLGKQQEEE